jgi:hypothetical protein
MRFYLTILYLASSLLSYAQEVSHHLVDFLPPHARLEERITGSERLQYSYLNADVFSLYEVDPSFGASPLVSFSLDSAGTFSNYRFHQDSGLFVSSYFDGIPCGDCSNPILARYALDGQLLWKDSILLIDPSTSSYFYNTSGGPFDAPRFWGPNKNKLVFRAHIAEEGDSFSEGLGYVFDWDGNVTSGPVHMSIAKPFNEVDTSYVMVNATSAWYYNSSFERDTIILLKDESFSYSSEVLFGFNPTIINRNLYYAELAPSSDEEGFPAIGRINNQGAQDWRSLSHLLWDNSLNNNIQEIIEVDSHLLCLQSYYSYDSANSKMTTSARLFWLNNMLTDTTLILDTKGLQSLDYLRSNSLRYYQEDSSLVFDFMTYENDGVTPFYFIKELVILSDVYPYYEGQDSLALSSNWQDGPSNISLYPNPTSGQFTLESEESGEYRILNLSGQLIQEGVFVAGENRIELGDVLPNGVYFLGIKTIGGNLLNFKISVSK